MKVFTSIIVFSLLLSQLQNGFAQINKRTITGTVTSSETSLPLEGVTVNVKGTDKNSGTQSDGVYFITVEAEDSVLVFSLAGYQSKEISITKNPDYNIVLAAAGKEAAILSLTQSMGRVVDLLRCCP